MKSAGIFTVAVLGIFSLLAAMVALNGVMLSFLWKWFIVPFGVRPIGIAQAIGIAILVSMLTHEGSARSSNEEDGEFNKMLIQIIAKVVAFGIAFCVSFLVPA